jgi:AraC-like DNA-binding protein
MPARDPRNPTTFWYDRRVAGLSLLRADFTTHEYPTHTHDALLVAVTESGGAEIRAGRVADEFHVQTLLVVNPAEPQSSRMKESRRWRYRSLYLEPAGLQGVASALGLPGMPSFDRSILRDRDLIDDFLLLHRALEQQGDPMRQRELLVGAFGRLVERDRRGGRRSQPPRRDHGRLERVMAVMRERHDSRLTLDELASDAGLTPYQLIRLFRAGVGMTPHAHLTQIRLGMARRHLGRGSTIAEAAVAAGFYDQSALTNHFKRCYGITPLQYLRAIQT